MNLAINRKVHLTISSLCKTVSTKPSNKTKWKSVVGLEIHSQIASVSKLFSGAATEFGSPVNSNVALFDASIPGTLPVLNKRCVDAAIKTALALNCRINETSMFDRKHYFYADLPSGYQITQQRQAIAVEGTFKFPVFVPGVSKKPYEKSVRLFQLQLEQDSGKSLHDDYQKISLVDLNRAGVPLMELVFAPDLTDGEEAAGLVKELILILTRLETCSCKMEEGALRVDANISLHKEGEPLGVRTEVKNIGSVRGVAQAIAYEIQRQTEILDAGGRIFNETRQWDAERKATVAMRDKEVVQDYRFMPEPNLPPLRVDPKSVDAIRNQLPELPQRTRDSLTLDHGLAPEIAIILVNESALLQHFLNICHDNPKRSRKMVTNLLINDLLSCCNKNKLSVAECKITSQQLGELIDMLEARAINLQMAKLILQEMVETEAVFSPQNIAAEKNWKLITDPVEIGKLCTEVIQRNPTLVAQYQKGKTKLLFALAGDIAKQTDNRVDMELVVEVLKKMLKA